MVAADRSLPGTWPELAAELARMPAAPLSDFAYYAERFRSLEVDSAFFGPSFYLAVDALIGGTVMGQGEMMRTAVEELTTAARTIVASDAPELDMLEDQNLGAVAVFTLQECAGWEPKATPVEVPLGRLLAMASEDDDYRRQTIWSLLGYGRLDGIERLLHEDPADAPPDPEAGFAASAFRVQLHLARCLWHGAGSAAAQPAWKAYLGYFPVNLSAEAATYPELLWAARAVRVAIGGAPPDTVVEWLRRQIA
jgi:hypothetical protein